MKRFITLLKQDFTVSFRNGHIWVILLLLAVMITLVYVIPENINTGHRELFLDSTDSGWISEKLQAAGVGREAIYQDREGMMEKLEAESGMIGVIAEGSAGDPRFTFVYYGDIPEQNLNLLKGSIEYVLGESDTPKFTVEYLRPKADPVPMNLFGIPVFIVFEVVLLGFLLAAVLIFQEKQEGSIRAYRVSPGGAAGYLISKTLLFMVLSIFYGGVLIAASLGAGVNYGKVILLICMASTLMTMLGILVASFFNGLSDWFIIGLIVLIGNILPFFSYLIPSFAPAYIKWIPSYHLIFAMRELLFPTGGSGAFMKAFTGLLWQNGIVFIAALFVVKRKLMSEQGLFHISRKESTRYA
ncbi:MAG: ABC transporter permease [Spirochaetia bacterium]